MSFEPSRRKNLGVALVVYFKINILKSRPIKPYRKQCEVAPGRNLKQEDLRYFDRYTLIVLSCIIGCVLKIN